MPEERHMKLPLACGIWAFVCLAGAFAGMWRGYGGPLRSPHSLRSSPCKWGLLRKPPLIA
jgi:hypothetical protein